MDRSADAAKAWRLLSGTMQYGASFELKSVQPWLYALSNIVMCIIQTLAQPQTLDKTTRGVQSEAVHDGKQMCVLCSFHSGNAMKQVSK